MRPARDDDVRVEPRSLASHAQEHHRVGQIRGSFITRTRVVRRTKTRAIEERVVREPALAPRPPGSRVAFSSCRGERCTCRGVPRVVVSASGRRRLRGDHVRGVEVVQRLRHPAFLRRVPGETRGRAPEAARTDRAAAREVLAERGRADVEAPVRVRRERARERERRREQPRDQRARGGKTRASPEETRARNHASRGSVARRSMDGRRERGWRASLCIDAGSFFSD